MRLFVIMILPFATLWAAYQERRALRLGVALSDAQLRDARELGVAFPERVRLLAVPEILLPGERVWRVVAGWLGWAHGPTAGMALRYGILIREDMWGRRRLVVHELAHTVQYERMGGLHGFLKEYLYECLALGYPAAPMEQEAIRIEREVCEQGRAG